MQILGLNRWVPWHRKESSEKVTMLETNSLTHFFNEGAEEECISGRLEVIQKIFLNTDTQECIFESTLDVKDFCLQLKLKDSFHSFNKKLKERKITLINTFPGNSQVGYKITEEGIPLLLAILIAGNLHFKSITLNLNVVKKDPNGFLSLFKQIPNLGIVREIFLSNHELTPQEQKQIEESLKRRDLTSFPLNMDFYKKETLVLIQNIFIDLSKQNQDKIQEKIHTEANPDEVHEANPDEVHEAKQDKTFAEFTTDVMINSISLGKKLFVETNVEKKKRFESLRKKHVNSTSLSFDQQLTASGIQLIIEILKKFNPTCTVKLNLNHFAPPENGFALLFNEVSQLKCVKEIDFTKHSLSKIDAEALVKTLKSRQQLVAKGQSEFNDNIVQAFAEDFYEYSNRDNKDIHSIIILVSFGE